TATCVFSRDVRQLVRRLKSVAAPDMSVLGAVQICSLVHRALDTDRVEAWHVEPGAYPASKVFVRRLRNCLVQRIVVQRDQRLTKRVTQRIDFATSERAPTER